MGILTIISLLISIVLGIIFYQDLRYRTLDIRYAIILVVLCCWYNAIHPVLDYSQTLLILAFITINIGALIGYFSIKEKRFVNPIDTKIGLGDIVFFLAIVPLFLIHQYILFFISGLLFSLVLTLLTQYITKKTKPMPLAGYLSLYLGSIFVINIIFKKAFLNLGNL